MAVLMTPGAGVWRRTPGAGIQGALFSDPLLRGLTFYAPLRSSLTPQRAISPTPTFARGGAGVQASYLGTDGLIHFVGADVPRFGAGVASNPTPGLLVEQQATNLLLRSQEFDVMWIKLQASVTANAAVAPDGSLTADKVVEDATNNYHRVNQAFSATAGQRYVKSAYAKAGERNWMLLEGVSVGDAIAFFDLTNGVVGSVTGTASPTAGMENVGNGWYRCWLSFVASTTGSQEVYLGPAGGDNAGSYQGDGASGIYFWGAQLETGSVPSSYVQTTSAATSRAGDSVSFPTSGNISHVEGMFSFWALTARNGAESLNAYSFDTTSGVNDSRITLNQDTAGNLDLILTAAGGGGSRRQRFALTAGNWPANSWHHIAGGWRADGTLVLYVDNQPVNNLVTSGVWSDLTGLGNTLWIGRYGGGGFQYGGLIRDFRIYDRILSASDVARLYAGGA